MTFPFQIEELPDTIDASIDVTDLALSNNNCGTTIANSSGVQVVPSSGPKKRYMIIDATKLPNDEAERLFVKRAYNRQSSERARKRTKETVKELLRQVHELHADKVELRRILATKEDEIKLLHNRYETLMTTNVTKRVDIYPHLNSIGTSTQNVLPLALYSPEQQPCSSLSLLQRQATSSSVGNYQHDVFAPLLSSWDCHRLSSYITFKK
jgi:hypothetical protein